MKHDVLLSRLRVFCENVERRRMRCEKLALLETGTKREVLLARRDVLREIFNEVYQIRVDHIRSGV